MSTVTAHTLFSRAARCSSGAISLGSPKPAVVSLPFAPNSGKKMRRSVCYSYANPTSDVHPDKISPFALVYPKSRSTEYWKINADEDETKVELKFFHMPTDVKTTDFLVTLQGDVLVIRKPPPGQKPQANDDVLFHVRLHVPELYDKKNIKAELEPGNLVVTIHRLSNPEVEKITNDVEVKKVGTP